MKKAKDHNTTVLQAYNSIVTCYASKLGHNLRAGSLNPALNICTLIFIPARVPSKPIPPPPPTAPNTNHDSLLSLVALLGGSRENDYSFIFITCPG